MSFSRFIRRGHAVQFLVPVAAGVVIEDSALVVVNDAGFASGLAQGVAVMGVAVGRADNSAGQDGEVLVRVRAGLARLKNSAARPVQAVGTAVLVEDELTLAAKPDAVELRAGISLGTDGDDLWAIVGPEMQASVGAADQALFIRVADDAALDQVTLGPTDEGKLVVVADRSGRGPQLNLVRAGAIRPVIGISGTVTVSFLDLVGQSLQVPAGPGIPVASAVPLAVRERFPGDEWPFSSGELTVLADGIIRTVLTLRLGVSGPAVYEFCIQKWDEGSQSWLDIACPLAQELGPQTAPYTLPGVDEASVPADAKIRLFVRHNGAQSETITFYRVLWITNYVYSAQN